MSWRIFPAILQDRGGCTSPLASWVDLWTPRVSVCSSMKWVVVVPAESECFSNTWLLGGCLRNRRQAGPPDVGVGFAGCLGWTSTLSQPAVCFGSLQRPALLWGCESRGGARGHQVRRAPMHLLGGGKLPHSRTRCRRQSRGLCCETGSWPLPSGFLIISEFLGW